MDAKFRSRVSCSVICCKNSYMRSMATRMYSVPKSEERCQQWVDFCKNPRMYNVPAELLTKRRRICNQHFADHCFMNAARISLVHDAVPSVCRVKGCPHHKGFVPARPTNIVTIVLDEDLESPDDPRSRPARASQRGVHWAAKRLKNNNNTNVKSRAVRFSTKDDPSWVDSSSSSSSPEPPTKTKRGLRSSVQDRDTDAEQTLVLDCYDDDDDVTSATLDGDVAGDDSLSTYVADDNNEKSALIYCRQVCDVLSRLPPDQATVARNLIDQVLLRAGKGLLDSDSRLTDLSDAGHTLTSMTPDLTLNALRGLSIDHAYT